MRKNLLIALIAGLSAASSIHAEVIGFNGDTTYHFGDGSPYMEAGFQISNSGDNFQGLLFWGTQPYNADPLGNTLSHNFSASTMTLSKADGGAFVFNSIDLGDVYNNAAGGNVQFNWTFANGTSGQTLVSLDDKVGLQTFSFNLANLSQVSWTPTTTYGPFLQLDNINVAAVPEPETYAMLLAGLGLMGGIARRRKQK